MAETNHMAQQPLLQNGHTTGVRAPSGVSLNTGENGCRHEQGDGQVSRASVPIAIIGMSCRFAGDATSPSKLWELCVDGKSAWSPIPENRFDARAVYNPDPDKPGRHHVLGGHFFKEDPYKFDAAFFNLSSDMAEAMDPQLRLLLESVYEATEDAGIPLNKLSGSNTSVAAGCFSRDYYDLLIRDTETMPRNAMTNTGSSMLANRVSYFFNLHGPSVAIDTACSTGLVALHQGCQTIRLEESEVAIIGASSALLSPDTFVGESVQGVLSPEGKSYALDSRAAGYGRGEGVASLILKRFDAALRDGDRVHAVIRETAVNQNGRSTTITSPSVDAQEKLTRDCYSRAGLDLGDTAFVEGHFTGTRVGDPVEAEAIYRTFGRSRAAGAPPVLVGSVKTNLGHTEPVSGLASLIKAVFVLKTGLIPPHLNFETANPDIPLQGWNLVVPRCVTPWPTGYPFRASVNNYGYGGTNAHIVLERAQFATSGIHASPSGAETQGRKHNIIHSVPKDDCTPAYVFVTSAKDAAAAATTVHQLADHLSAVMGTAEEPSPRDLAFTLSERRTRFPWVTALRAKTLFELVDRSRHPGLEPTHSTKSPRIGYVFNGNGAQWYGMGRELLAAYPVFAQSIHLADAGLRKAGTPWSLKEELLRTGIKGGDKLENAEIRTRLSIAAVALQMALVDLLTSWGIRPSGIVSHSVGEIAAAYAVGALTFQQALNITSLRNNIFVGRKMHISGQGGMLAVGIGPEEAAMYISRLACDGCLIVGCINSPESVTLSGDLAAIDEMEDMLTQDHVFARRLNVPIPFHSDLILPIVPEYTERLCSLLPETCNWDEDGPVFASPVTGGVISPREGLNFDHWIRNLVQPTLFSSALEAMVYGASSAKDYPSPLQQQVDFIVEIGAHGQLAAPIRQTLSRCNNSPIPYASCLKRSVNAVDTMQDLAACLVSHGYAVDLAAVNNTYSSPSPSFVANLPSYPWTHNRRYWSSSRIVHEHKFPRYPAHELLGLHVAGSNPLTPTWRHFLRLSDESLPWLADHQVEGMVVFPGAGYVTMAIEAIRMLVDPSETEIRGYKLRDVEIAHSLQIPDSKEGVEIIFQMDRCSDKDLDSDGWWDFRVCSAQNPKHQTSNVTCVEHCRGSVSAEKKTTMAGARKGWLRKDTVRRNQHHDGLAFLASDTETQGIIVDVDQLFADMRGMGIHHGPAFQNIITARAALDQRKITCDFAIAGAASPASPEATDTRSEYALHPTTLDSAFQVGYAALDDDMRRGCFYVPRYIGSVYVGRDAKRSGGHHLRALTELVSREVGRGFTSTITIVDADSGPEDDLSCCEIRINNLYCQAVPRDIKDSAESSSPAPNCGKVAWVPDVLHNMPDSIKDSMRLGLTNEEADWEERVRRGAYYFIQDTVSQLHDECQDKWVWHHKKLMAWMNIVVGNSESDDVGDLGLGSDMLRTWADHYNSSTPEARRGFLDHLSSETVSGQLLCRIGNRLADIIRGQVTPLELMMEDGLLGRYYEEFPSSVRLYQHTQTVVSLFAAKNPGARVLEIGAGTGGATTTVLTALSSVDTDNNDSKPVPKFGHYDFTDVSAGFFDAARHKFAAWDSQGVMSFKRLDIEADPGTQPDFGPKSTGTYDLVIASLVLHATANLERTMRNVHRLLRPGGTLIMLEGTRGRLDSHLIFGTLPGWWLAEEPGRCLSPMTSLDEWDSILRATNFEEGVEFHIEDCEVNQYQTFSVMVTTATPDERRYPQSFTIIYVDVPPPDEWLKQIRDLIHSRMDADVHVECLADLNRSHIEDEVCLFVGEIERPILHEMDSDTFNKLRRLLVDSQGVLWVTCGGAVDGAVPEMALAQGLLRTLRQEARSKRSVLLDFEPMDYMDTLWTSERAEEIAHVLHASFDFGANSCDIDFEYSIKNRVPHVPRAIPDTSLNMADTVAMEQFWKPGRDLTLGSNSSGSLGALHFIETSVFNMDLPKGYVEIEPRAFGLNFRDVLIALGEIEGTSVFGRECSGIVSRLGPETAESGLRVGDRVCAGCADGWGTKQRALWQCVVRIPDNISWIEAAVIPVAYGTAWITLREHARLQKGESLLIHAATGGFGQAVLALAQYMGVGTIFATCSTLEKRQLLVSQYGLHGDNIFSSRIDEFESAIMDKTGGRGVDVVINSLAGPLFKASWNIIARNGRFIDVGKKESQAGRHLDMRPFGRCATMTAVDLSQDALDPSSGGRPHLLREAITACVKLFAERAVRAPVPLTEFSVSDMEKVMRLMQAGTHLGKMVFVPKSDDLVRVVSQPQPVALLHDATYLIVGGARGIGASIARWMVGKGAKHLVLVSRNAKGTEGVGSLVQMAEEKGCNVQLHNCDVGDRKAFLDLVAKFQESTLPPIRGIITGAMVLDDTILENMTHAQWRTAIRPKVDGTMNLHRFLGCHVEFFIMLSSVTGVTGNASQANYAAGNAFQDALARHRTTGGMPARSLDLGAVADVGFIANADQATIERNVALLGGTSINMAQVLHMIEDAIRHPLRTSPDDAVALVGIPRDLIASGNNFGGDIRFSSLRGMPNTSGFSQDATKSSPTQIPRLLGSLIDNGPSLTLDKVAEIVCTLVGSKLCEIFSLAAEEIDVSLPLAHYGVDSLVGVELRNWLGSAVKVKVTIFEILQSRSVAEFAGMVAERTGHRI